MDKDPVKASQDFSTLPRRSGLLYLRERGRRRREGLPRHRRSHRRRTCRRTTHRCSTRSSTHPGPMTRTHVAAALPPLPRPPNRNSLGSRPGDRRVVTHRPVAAPRRASDHQLLVVRPDPAHRRPEDPAVPRSGPHRGQPGGLVTALMPGRQALSDQEAHALPDPREAELLSSRISGMTLPFSPFAKSRPLSRCFVTLVPPPVGLRGARPQIMPRSLCGA